MYLIRCEDCSNQKETVHLIRGLKRFARHIYAHTVRGDSAQERALCRSCGICLPGGVSGKAAATHVKSCKGTSGVTEVSVIRQTFACAICGILLARKDTLRLHLKVQFTVCNKIFLKKSRFDFLSILKII